MNDHKEARVKTHSEDFHAYKYQGNAGRKGVKRLKVMLRRQSRAILKRMSRRKVYE